MVEEFIKELKLLTPFNFKESPIVVSLINRLFSYESVALSQEVLLPRFLLEFVLKAEVALFRQTFEHLFELLLEQMAKFNKELLSFSVPGTSYLPVHQLQIIIHKLLNFEEIEGGVAQVLQKGDPQQIEKYIGAKDKCSKAQLLKQRFRCSNKKKHLELTQTMVSCFRKRKDKLIRSPFQNKSKTTSSADGFLLLFARLFVQDPELQQAFKEQSNDQKEQFAAGAALFLFYSYERKVMSQTSCYIQFLRQLVLIGQINLGMVPSPSSFYFNKVPVVNCSSLASFLVCELIFGISTGNFKSNHQELACIDFYLAFALLQTLLPQSRPERSIFDALQYWSKLIRQHYYQIPFWIVISRQFRQQAKDLPDLCSKLEQIDQKLSKAKFKLVFNEVPKQVSLAEAIAFTSQMQVEGAFDKHYNAHLHNRMPLVDRGGLFWSKLLAKRQIAR